MIIRCPWAESDDLMKEYHDKEWGIPVHDDIRHFEFLILEINQAGLSWRTILNKRANFRKAYSNSNPSVVAKYDTNKVSELLGNAGIIRNNKKIEASIHNAKLFVDIQKEIGSFDKYLWAFVKNKQVINNWEREDEIPAKTHLSDAVSRDLKKRGFKFIGSTILYAHLQAVGIINDHLVSCHRYKIQA